MIKYLVGVDEAGRGPLAGPVSVGVVAVPLGLKTALAKYGVKDSKKLSARDREQWYKWLAKERRVRKITFVTALISSKVIDKKGIVPAVKMGIGRCFTRLKLPPRECAVLLDGSLLAPKIFKQQKTIIKGDETVPIIALASIAAKVRRDRLMVKLAKKYSGYGFEVHKGYGTAAHYRAIKKRGLSTLHRLSFLNPRSKIKR